MEHKHQGLGLREEQKWCLAPRSGPANHINNSDSSDSLFSYIVAEGLAQQKQTLQGYSLFINESEAHSVKQEWRSKLN